MHGHRSELQFTCNLSSHVKVCMHSCLYSAKSSIWVHLCFRGHTDRKPVRWIFFANNTNFQFPPPLPQATSYTCSPSCFSVLHLMLFTFSQSLHSIKHYGAGALVSVQSLRLFATPLLTPCVSTLWSLIFEFQLGLPHSFQFVWINHWWLSVHLGERKAHPTASERAASLRSAWHQRPCRPLTDEQKHMVPHLASSLACSFPQRTSALWLSLSQCLTVEQRRLLSKDSLGKQQPSDLTADEWRWGEESDSQFDAKGKRVGRPGLLK